MTRFFLTRLAIAAGCVVPLGSAASGQAPTTVRPGTPPRIIWVRPGTPPVGRPATVTESRPPAPQPAAKPDEAIAPAAAVAPPVAEPLPPAPPPTPADTVTWVRPGAPVVPERPPVLVEVRPEPTAPPVVLVEARDEPTTPAPMPVLSPMPTPQAIPARPVTALPPEGWHRAGSSRDLPETAPPAPPPRPIGVPPPDMPVGDAGTTTEKKDDKKDGEKKDGEKKDDKKKEEPKPTWHGHKHPTQPFPPPGASPVAPTDPGYYTLLDHVRGDYQEKPPRWPYPRSGPIGLPFNEIDFKYLDALPFEERDWAERLHRVPVGDHWLFSTGGELRTRYNYETNTRLTGQNDVYQLFRTRLYTDVWYEDYFRFYTEFYYGDTVWQDVAPYARDVNRGDVQQMFVDLKLGEYDCDPIYVRLGRQEMLYGSQRLVSTNDWGNNRPRFDGLKLFYRSAKLDADVFVTRPTQVRFGQLDPWDRNQTFSGAWATYKPKKGTFVDLYYLNLENDNPGVAKGQFKTGSYNVSTFGSRYYGKFDNGLLIDVEGMLQFGHWADQTILAQAVHVYGGWHFKDCCWTPTVWVGYDYASGDPDPNNTGQRRTFNQLFQFGHYYYGFIDVTGGQNIRDWNVQAYAYPANWLTTGVQYHVFRLDSNKDALYNSAGAATRQDRTGKAGDDVGSEVDVLVNFHLTDRQDVFVNYGHFFPGPFIKATGPSFGLDYVYLQYSMRW